MARQQEVSADVRKAATAALRKLGFTRTAAPDSIPPSGVVYFEGTDGTLQMFPVKFQQYDQAGERVFVGVCYRKV